MNSQDRQRYRLGLVFLLMLLCGRIPSCRVRRWLYRRVFHVRIGRGSVIYGGAEIRAGWNVTIGDHSSIGHYAILDGRGGLQIGNNVNMSTGVWIWTQQHDVQSPDFAMTASPVVIDDYAWISCRAVILPGVHVGRGAVVAAGAVVTRDVPPFAIVGGVPAQVIGRRNDDLRYELNWYQPFF